MSMEAFLQFFISHNQAIINWLFVCVLALSAFVALMTLLSRHGEGHAESAGSSPHDLEVALRKVIEEKIPSVVQGAVVSAAGASAGLVGTAVTHDDVVPAQMAQALQAELDAKKAEVVKIRSEMESKEKEFQELKAVAANAPAAAAAGASESNVAVSAETDGLRTKIQELEAKLAEYSIIEDDIADLCLFKEENARLKEELEKLKGDSADSLTIGEGEDLNSDPLMTEADPVAALMAEEEPAFEALAAVEEPVAETAPILEVVPEPVVAVEAAPAPAVDDPLAAELDTEKMMAEMASLSVSEEEEDIGHILSEAGDLDRMSEEAAVMDEPVKKSS